MAADDQFVAGGETGLNHREPSATGAQDQRAQAGGTSFVDQRFGAVETLQDRVPRDHDDILETVLRDTHEGSHPGTKFAHLIVDVDLERERPAQVVRCRFAGAFR